MPDAIIWIQQKPDGILAAAVDAEELVVGGQTVLRQRVATVGGSGDPASAREATLQQVRDRADFPLPAGQLATLTPPATVIVADGGGSITVDGTLAVSNFPATQTIAGTVTANVGTGTQPVSGTVTANAGAGPWPVTDNGASLTVDGSVSISGSAAVTGPLTDGQLRASAVPVSGTVALDSASLAALETTGVAVSNFPATQPVSGTVTATGPLTDAQLRASAVPISGTVTANVGTGTQPVSGTVSVSGAVDESPATLAVTATGAAAAAVTATLPAVAGQFHYITSIQIIYYATVAVVGTATPVVVTTTNLPGSPAFTFPRAMAIGTVNEQKFEFPISLKSSVVNTATTIVGPATTSILWRINVFYRAGA